MGSSSEDPNSINGSAGGLVWVRPRNGSWWPGKILGPDELPEGSVSAPRSGTPVKLLGKEDSSVDWYNLEKSKRVKAFHCIDYDHCIEKIKASASNNLSKKVAKYVKRDGAILHALELESVRLGKNHPDFDESPSAFYSSEESEDFDENSNSSEDDSDLAPNDSEDGVGGSKRTRGLEDLGINVDLSLKRKISQICHNQEFLKRKNRRRTLTKVLECTTMVSVPIGERLSSPDGVSLLESKGSKKNDSDSNGVPLEGKCKQKENEICSEVREKESFGRLFDVPLVDEEKRSAGLPSIISDAPKQAQLGPQTQSSPSSHLDTLSLPNEENDESGPISSGSGAADVHISPKTENGNPEWRSKGKRNSRSRKTDPLDEGRNVGPTTQHLVMSTPIGQIRLLSYRQSRFTVNPKYDSSDFSLRHHISSFGLYDVPLEVKSSYGTHRVPYISLTSKFTGHPIVGHPLAVEVLDDDLINSISECYYNLSEHYMSAFEGGGRVYKRKVPRGRPRNTRHHGRGLLSKSLKSRKNGLLFKKTRKLSSLTGAHRLSRDEKLVVKVKGPSIACVPLNIIFSRINADLSSSGRPGPRPIVTSGM